MNIKFLCIILFGLLFYTFLYTFFFCQEKYDRLIDIYFDLLHVKYNSCENNINYELLIPIHDIII